MPNCLIVQHVAPESAFALSDALSASGVTIESCRVFEGDPVPERSDDLDGLVVMGGPMSAGSDEGFPSRSAEIALIADALARGVPTLGVCLGAQLLAVAGGASVVPGRSGSEIGWGPVELTAACQEDRLFAGLPGSLTVMHWHGETFELPEGSERLMGNANYANQGFRIGKAAWGLQFHLEVTAPAVEGFLVAFAPDAELAPGGPAAIKAATPDALAGLTGARTLVFERFSALVVSRVARGDLVDSP